VEPAVDGVLANGTGVNASSFITDSFSRIIGDEFLVAIGSADNLSHGQTPPTSLTQTGITWVNTDNVTRAGITLSVWHGVATSSGSSAMTANFAGTQLSMIWGIVRLAGVSTIVQSEENHGDPFSGGWLDVSMAAMQPDGMVILSGIRSGSGPAPAVRSGYTGIYSFAIDSPIMTLVVAKAIPGVSPVGIQQPIGFGDDMVAIATEYGV
jgi:hypothetical protein